MDWKWLLTSFEGRINRAKYWAGIVVLWAALTIIGMIAMTMYGMQFSERGMPVFGGAGGVVMLIAQLAAVYASLAVLAKRWHDRDKSGWWTLIGLVPIVGGIWILIECGCLEGTNGANRYGEDPLAGKR